MVPSVLQVMDQTTVVAVDDYAHMDLDRDTAALLLAIEAASSEGLPAVLREMEHACRSSGADFVATTMDENEGEQLLQVRRLAYTALEHRGRPVLDDIVVPPAALSAMLAAVERVSTQHTTTIATFGHAGTGNLHPTILLEPTASPTARADAERALQAIISAAVSLGGTISGEHGVGSLKSHPLTANIDTEATRLHRGIKHLFDPSGFLNPGKVIT